MGFLGIDFGTSTTSAALARLPNAVTNTLQMLADPQGDSIVPSVVAFPPAGAVTVGRSARTRRLRDPANSIYSVKRVLGKRWRSSEVRRFVAAHGAEMVECASGDPCFVTRHGKLSPIEIAGYLFAYIAEWQHVSLSQLQGVTVAVPVSAIKAERQATIDAAARGGFADVQLIDEPVAAALVYGDYDPAHRTVAVYDFGGGTFDFAVLRRAGSSFELLASGGDGYLGGDDIDLECANYVASEILSKYRWDVKTSKASFETLLYLCEQAKTRLSAADRQVINLGSVDAVLNGKSVALERERVEALAQPFIRRTFICCDNVLAQAGVQARDLDAIFLSGGSSRMPLVASTLAHYFGKPPIMQYEPERVVAMGAAIAASRRR